MDAGVLDFVLEGLERALELERELGVRSVTFDRSLLTDAPKIAPPPAPKPVPPPAPKPVAPIPVPKIAPKPVASPPRREAPPSLGELVFLHHCPLSPKGAEMMTKIITALHRTCETTPIVVAPPTPRARVIVVLGARALHLYYPEMRGEPGDWKKTPEGDDVLITYSPEYILRFVEVTPAVKRLKEGMWRSLKAVVQRLRLPPQA